jgi:hypothetical protein
MVFVVGDDPSLREALSSLLRSVGLPVELFGSAPELLQTKLPDIVSRPCRHAIREERAGRARETTRGSVFRISRSTVILPVQ